MPADPVSPVVPARPGGTGAAARACALGPAYTRSGARVRPLTEAQRATRDGILRDDRAEDYEAVACPCGGEARDLLLSEVDRYGLRCDFRLCADCGLVRLSPRWREERYRRFYEEEYRSLYNATGQSKRDFLRVVADSPPVRGLADWVAEVAARERPSEERVTIVEIGSGGGWNLSRLPAPWERIGYDVDEEYLALGTSEFGVAMKWGFVEEAFEDVGRADLVLLSHVVEHFSRPEEELRRIAGRMRPNALLLVEVPGIFRIHRTNLDVMSYMQGAHTFTYCGATLRAACERAGLEVIRCDETVRAVCRPVGASASRAGSPDAELAPRILRYLRLCEAGYGGYLRLRRIPLVGRYLGALWRRAYFPALAAWVPPAG